MVETPSSSDPGPDPAASQPTALPTTQPSPTLQPSEAAAAPSGGVGPQDDISDTVVATGQESEAVSVTEATTEAVPEALTEALTEAAAPQPAPEPTPPAALPDVPSIAATLEVPPREPRLSEGEGGEWELLVGKVNAWFASGELQSRWQQIRGPLKGVAILIALLLAARVYASVVGTIDGIPLVSGLLELTGLIVLVRFALTKLSRTSEREKVLADWKRRWEDFRGGA